MASEEALFFRVMAKIKLHPNMLLEHGLADTASYFIEVVALRRDVMTDLMGIGRGGRRYLPLDATESEIVQAAWSAMTSYTHHEDREAFEYEGVRVFGPHISVRAHMEAAKQTEPARDLSRYTDNMLKRQLLRRVEKEPVHPDV